MVLTIVGEAVESRLCKQGFRLAGLRHELEPFEGAWPDAFCSRCCAWGHVAPQCSAAVPQVRLLQGKPPGGRSSAPCRGYRVKRGHACAHVVARCRNCSGPHLSQANACPVKREARRLAKGWPPSPPRREYRGLASPEDETPEGPATGMARWGSRGSWGPRPGGGRGAED